MGNFIPRYYKNINIKTEDITFDNLIKPHRIIPYLKKEAYTSYITVILGEPASGKTYQLKYHYKEHTDNSRYITLSTLRKTDSIEENVKTILIDSIDEALDNSDNKNLARNLKDYILRCQIINPETMFVITSRLLEWNNYFKEELETIDKELRVYRLLPLTDEDINLLLDVKFISHIEFWKFIDENHLKPLLGNIMIIQNIIDEFDSYKETSTNYTKIYENIIQKLLIIKGDDRERQGVSLVIASSLATYMLLNRKEFITNNELGIIVRELYKIEEKSITIDELEILLNSELFNKKENQFSFKQKTLQEYLVAYFIDYKKLDSAKIKELFSHELRFREEFEELVIYLTNIQPKLFDDFLGFDPFIFRRHPALMETQQQKLFLAIAHKLKNEEYRLYGKWAYLDGTTIVKYKDLEDLVQLVKENIKSSDINLLTFTFLMKILEFNYSGELEDYIFQILELVEDKKKYISYSFINHDDFNHRVFNLLNTYNLFEKNEHTVFSFESRLFQSLYGIKSKWGYNNQVDYTNIDFNKIINLLEYIPSNQLKSIVPFLQEKDVEAWFIYIVNNFNKTRYNPNYLAWLISSLLENKITIDSIIEFLTTNKIFSLHFHSQEMNFNFENIDKRLWDLFFQPEKEFYFDMAIKDILSLYKITYVNVEELTKQYPIKEFPECYTYFRNKIEDIDSLLMEDKTFNKYMNKLWKKHKEQQKEWDEEIQKEIEKNPSHSIQKTFDDICEESQQRRDKLDFYNLYFCSLNNNKNIEDTFTVEEKKQFIEWIKIDYLHDESYLELKKDLTNNSLSNQPTFLFHYLFKNIKEEEIFELIDSKESFVKLFWHFYKYMDNLSSKTFQNISQKYIPDLITLTIESIELSLVQSENIKIGNYSQVQTLFETLNIYNKESLFSLIKYLKAILYMRYIKVEDSDALLHTLSLDSESFEFIKGLMLYDKESDSKYLSILFKIDIEKATKYSLEAYNKISKKRPLIRKIKDFFSCEHEIINKQYDNLKINPEKIRFFHSLIKAIKDLESDKLNLSLIKIILTNYYEFFTEYEQPNGVYTPDIYSDMNSEIQKLWTYLENTTKYITLLEKLSKSANKALNNNANHYLDKVHNLQAKKREYSNSYYKKIFDEEYGMNKNNISIKNSTINGSIIDNSKNKTVNNNKEKQEDNNKKSALKWWIISSIVALISFTLVWFTFSSWQWGLGSGILSFLIMTGFNPKRYYRRMATASFLILGLQLLSFKGLIVIPKNDFVHGFLSIGEHSIPWIGILFGVIMIVCLILDYFENKET
ncbi:MAG TPA: hypothetical protein EYG73_01905 [Arcobacter sp.]|nr:hypothetical protein [Arcobacter sp.]